MSNPRFFQEQYLQSMNKLNADNKSNAEILKSWLESYAAQLIANPSNKYQANYKDIQNNLSSPEPKPTITLDRYFAGEATKFPEPKIAASSVLAELKYKTFETEICDEKSELRGCRLRIEKDSALIDPGGPSYSNPLFAMLIAKRVEGFKVVVDFTKPKPRCVIQ